MRRAGRSLRRPAYSPPCSVHPLRLRHAPSTKQLQRVPRSSHQRGALAAARACPATRARSHARGPPRRSVPAPARSARPQLDRIPHRPPRPPSAPPFRRRSARAPCSPAPRAEVARQLCHGAARAPHALVQRASARRARHVQAAIHHRQRLAVDLERARMRGDCDPIRQSRWPPSRRSRPARAPGSAPSRCHSPSLCGSPRSPRRVRASALRKRFAASATYSIRGAPIVLQRARIGGGRGGRSSPRSSRRGCPSRSNRAYRARSSPRRLPPIARTSSSSPSASSSSSRLRLFAWYSSGCSAPPAASFGADSARTLPPRLMPRDCPR